MYLSRFTVSETVLWLKQCILGYVETLCDTLENDSENCSKNQLASVSYQDPFMRVHNTTLQEVALQVSGCHTSIEGGSTGVIQKCLCTTTQIYDYPKHNVFEFRKVRDKNDYASVINSS